MDVDCARGSGWLSCTVAVGLVMLAAETFPRQVYAQTRGIAKSEAAAWGARDVRSRHFLVHTDLSAREADELIERLETMLRLISTYWDRPMRGVIECYVVRDLDQFPADAMDPGGIWAMRNFEGTTVMRTATDGRSYLAKSVVYSTARLEVVQHEAVHAYCHHTFGRIGPVWYAEGMAEMGHYWKEGDSAVRAEPREIKFLRDNPPKSLAEILLPAQFSGDSWQNYASRWSLCHFLINHPSYASQFVALGRRILAGEDVNFEQAFTATPRELSFEYFFFLQHIERGYRVDLCAWDWKKTSVCLRHGRVLRTTVAAGRGWQPSGLAVESGTPYEYAAVGKWRIAEKHKAVDGSGNDAGCGRLVGVLMKDYQLGAEFDLGAEGVLQSPACGDLYLRCRNSWSNLAGDSGRIAVKFKVQRRDPPLHEPD